ncbi:MAG: hypothetical protein ACHQ2Z_02100 [Elusimicrobiota bacterium]
MTRTDSTQKQRLDEVLEDVSRRRGALVVFDLDDTLFSTANRHLRILREFADLLETRDPAAAGLLRAVERERLRYAVTDTAKDAGVAETVAADLRKFWFDRFFKNRYLLEDDVVPGAPAYCAEVLARGGVIVYVTGRDEAMREGTERSFTRHGFPEPDEKSVRLILKPAFEAPDLAFKTEVVARLKTMGRVAASFENEPTHINMFRDAFPEAKHFLLDTKHSGKPVIPHPEVLKIGDFRR